MPEDQAGPERDAEDEQVHTGELLGREPPADVQVGGLQDSPPPHGARERGDVRLLLHHGDVFHPAAQIGAQARYGPVADVPGGDRAGRDHRGGEPQDQGAQVHTGVQVPVLRCAAQRQLVGGFGQRHFLAGFLLRIRILFAVSYL